MNIQQMVMDTIGDIFTGKDPEAVNRAKAVVERNRDWIIEILSGVHSETMRRDKTYREFVAEALKQKEQPKLKEEVFA